VNRYALRAGNGGGVYLTDGASFNMHDGYIENNIATAIGTAVSSALGGDAINLSNGGGVYATGAGTTFHMQDGAIRNNRAVRTVNSAPTIPLGAGNVKVLAGNGGGVHIYDDAIFTMDGGVIYGNTATATGNDTPDNTTNLYALSNGGGVFISGTAVQGAPDLARFFMNGGTIRDNYAIGAAAGALTFSGNGGGVCAMSRAQFHMAGGVISGNAAIDNNTTTPPTEGGLRRGNGAGVYLSRGFDTQLGLRLSFNMSGGEIREHTNVSRHGVAVFISGGRVEFGGTARITDNHSPNNGGGIFIENAGTLNINGGTIDGNTAQQDGGGIFMNAAGIILNMQSGSITNNTANDGGGIFVPHANLPNITIAEDAIFEGNTARNGAFADNDLYAAHGHRIRPDSVSVRWSGQIPGGSGNFGEMGHVFTNFDINARGALLWRVTYAAKGDAGSVTATVGTNDFPIENGTFVLSGTNVNFAAVPSSELEFWEIQTRATEIAADGSEVPFSSFGTQTGASYTHPVTEHTHVTGNFNSSTITTTTLSISKEITGKFGNRSNDFEFTVFFTDLDGKPLPAGTQFDYTGDIAADSGAAAPPDGILVLDSNGSASFRLGHGQLITVKGVPLGRYVQIVETPDAKYTASFADSIYEGIIFNSNETGSLYITEGRSFSFYNERIVIVPTGINLGGAGVVIQLLVLLLLAAMIMFAADGAYRRKRRFCKL